MHRKTPQEKKAESYAKDRRNTYGENAKSSRKNIARRKRARARGERRIAREAFAPAVLDEAWIDGVDARAKRTHRKGWQKFPDQPLGEVVQDKLARREALQENRRRRKRAPDA